MNRRGFLAILSATPLFGRFASAQPADQRLHNNAKDAEERALLSRLLGVKVEKTDQAKFEWLEYGQHPTLPTAYFNLTQIVITPAACYDRGCLRTWEEHRDDALVGHIRTVKEVLEHGQRYRVESRPEHITYTGGRLFWAHDYGQQHPYEVRSFRGRALRYTRTDNDIGGRWLSDIGYRPLRAS